MRSAELHWERSGWNLHKVVGVVWQFFTEVRIFRNMRHGLDQLIADAFAASPAIGEDGIAHEDDRGPVFIEMADFINSGVSDHLSGHQGAIRLVKNSSVSQTHFMQAPGCR